MEIDEKTTNLIYQDFGDKKGGSASQEKLQAIKLPDLQSKRFLDLGCNAGFFCKHAKQAGASYVLGVDNKESIIQIARERHPDIEFLDTGWEKFPDGIFDVIICLSAIHYAEDPCSLATDIFGHLSVGGLFVLEGGIVDEGILPWSDILVASWREVGDRVRHLSSGFIERHLLKDFEWKRIGQSLLQGGDLVPRSVIHAHKTEKTVRNIERPVHRVCLVEYAQALAASAPTIHRSMPSYEYVRALGEQEAPIDAEALETILLGSARFEAFVSDIVYALGNHAIVLDVKPSVSENLLHRFKESMRFNKTEVRLAPASNSKLESQTGIRPTIEDKEILDRMSAGVEFINDANDQSIFSIILRDYDFEGKSVAHVSATDLDMAHQLLDAKVAKCTVISRSKLTSSDDRLNCQQGSPWDISQSGFDFIFFDADEIEGFDHIGDVDRFVSGLGQTMKPDAAAFCVLRTGQNQSSWDVYNSIILGPLGRLPSSPYLYDNMLRDFAVRPLLLKNNDQHHEYSSARLFRLTKRTRTLLLVVGQSHSGKTTLARGLREIDKTSHLSSDYIFYELFRQQELGELPGVSRRLLELAGGGSAEATGQFFRDVEANENLLKEYLTLASNLLPNHGNLVSMDVDFRTPERVEYAKQFFTDAGFSVWVAER